MLILDGNNLGERHRDLNKKVTEAADKETNFDDVKLQEESSDIDKLFKIDLASKYQNIDYILEVLKSGDIFHITRALKCLWLYDDKHSDYINLNYLKTSIFPHMSMKMTRKMLTSVSMNLKNGERAIEFYSYCKEAKMRDYAHKFLIITPNTFKLQILKNWNDFNSFRNYKFLKTFISNSFELAEAYLTLHDYNRYIIYELRFMYSVSDEKYLKVLETHETNDARYPNCSQRLGLRISKDILTHHKNRVIKYPVLYINKLNKNMLIRYLTCEDVKSLAFGLLPDSSDYFWSIDLYHIYQFLFEKILKEERFNFLKQLFTTKYPDDPFEMNLKFYNLKYFELLSPEERETWALLHIERDEDLPGIENFMWYKFVSFGKAFPGIKRYIFLTPDKDKRSRIVNILPETARNQEELKVLLNYYYQRHVNESDEHKDSFINRVIANHDIYSFDSECWISLDNLFCSLEVYTTGAYVREEYKVRALFYHILHNMEFPEALNEYINYVNYYHISSIIDQLSTDRNTVIAKYLLNYYAEKIKVLIDKPREETEDETNEYCSTVNYEINSEIHRIWNVIYTFKREHDECPEIVLEYMKSHMDVYESHENFKTVFQKRTEGDFVRWLKKDIIMCVDGISEIRCNTYRWNFRLCRLLRKLKVYFPNDAAKEYLEYFTEYLSDVPQGRREYRNVKMAVVGVLYLADENFKISLLDKNVPESPKIDHRNIDNRILQVQKAICRLAYHSRPPLPLSNILKYITGDYVHYCLPVFYNYLANSPSVETFIRSILDAPLSIQKHGLRMAFRTYSPETLKPLILDVWKKTKNVSLRMLLFQTLFNRIINENEEGQRKLYEVLKLYTQDLNKDDHDEVYSLLVSDSMPDEFKGDLIETAWLTVSKFLDKSLDFRRKISVIYHMERFLHLVKREFPRLQIIDDHVQDMLFMKNIKTRYFSSCLGELIEAKWNLTAKYIVNFKNKEEQQRSLQLVRIIITQCTQLWNYVDSDTYTVRKFTKRFIQTIMNKDPNNKEFCAHMVPIYQCILDELKKSLKKQDIFLMSWELNLSIVARNIIHNEIYCVDNEGGKQRNVSSQEIAVIYAHKLGNIIRVLVENREFYHCFYQSVADIISNIGQTICDILSVNHSGFNYYISDGLTDIKITETHVIALLMLPKDPPHAWGNEHIESIKKIKKIDNEEIQTFLYQKYVMSDCCVRNYI